MVALSLSFWPCINALSSPFAASSIMRARNVENMSMTKTESLMPLISLAIRMPNQ